MTSMLDVTGWTLPQQMGVDVRTIERSFDPPVLSRVNATVVAPARVWGDRKPAFFVVDGRGNGAAIAAKPGYPTVLVPFGMIPNTLTPREVSRKRRAM